MYGGDLGAGGGGNWKAPDDPSLVVGGKDDVSITQFFVMIKMINCKIIIATFDKQSH